MAILEFCTTFRADMLIELDSIEDRLTQLGKPRPEIIKIEPQDLVLPNDELQNIMDNLNKL